MANASTPSQPSSAKLLPNWKPAKLPTGEPIIGRSCRLEKLTLGHTDDLWAAINLDKEQKLWNYLPYGPFEDLEAYKAWVQHVSQDDEDIFYAIIGNDTDTAVGVGALACLNPTFGSIEIGHLCFTPLMQRSTKSSEAIMMMIKTGFQLGYRRVVWRSQVLNAASVSAAKRYGFKFECNFKNYSVVKGYNRNNVWLSIIEEDWPELEKIYDEWLDLALSGQHKSLSEIVKNVSGSSSPRDISLWNRIPPTQNRLKDYPDLKENFVINSLGLPVGRPVLNWFPPPLPSLDDIEKPTCRITPLLKDHFLNLFESFSIDKQGTTWTYSVRGPFTNFAQFKEEFKKLVQSKDHLFFAVIDLQTGKPVGTTAFSSINPDYGSIELDGLHFSPLMKGTAMKSEAVILMVRKALMSGYRRLAWKCNTEDQESITTALRTGFQYEGVFRNDAVIKGRNQDTAWFSVTDDEYMCIKIISTPIAGIN